MCVYYNDQLNIQKKNYEDTKSCRWCSVDSGRVEWLMRYYFFWPFSLCACMKLWESFHSSSSLHSMNLTLLHQLYNAKATKKTAATNLNYLQTTWKIHNTTRMKREETSWNDVKMHSFEFEWCAHFFTTCKKHVQCEWDSKNCFLKNSLSHVLLKSSLFASFSSVAL